ncbi:MAG: hypothetical protein J7L38_05355 [Thermoproteales archaeon]|nr:hypothetical protein [Thermoproteales archaeon]
MKIKGLRRRLSKGLTYINLLFGVFEHKGFLTIMLLLLFYTASLTLRALPARWGVYLTEFDPYYEYYLAVKIVEKGPLWWFNWFTGEREFDKLFWYPWGRDLRATSPPGISFISAYTYLFLKALGWNIDLYTVHSFIPVIWAPLAIIIVYLIGRSLKDDFTGIVAAFLLSFNSAYLSRTMMGGKHESVAIPLMLLAFYFYLKIIESKKFTVKISYSIASALMVWSVALSWGGYLYPWNLLALTTLILILLDKVKSQGDYISLGLTSIVSSILISIIPRYGLRGAFTSIAALLPSSAAAVCFLLSIGINISSIRNALQSTRTRVIAVLVVIVIGIVLWRIGIISSISGRILSVVIPYKRSPLIESVAEHRYPTWAMIYSDYKVWLLFSFLGVYLLVKRMDPKGIFGGLFFISALYSAMSLARLSLLLAPPLFLVAGYSLAFLLEKLAEGLETGEKTFKRTRPSVQKEYYAITILTILLIAFIGAYDLTYSIAYAHTPSLIVTSSIPVSEAFFTYYPDTEIMRFSDWLSALEWMSENLPEDAVVASWWDYGYWIAVNTNRSTVCDNGTLNSTQIALVAKAFLSSEEEALKIFRQLGVTHVVVFDPFAFPFTNGLPLTQLGISLYFPQPQGLGDFGKSYWMAKIAGLDPEKYIATARISSGNQYLNIIVPADTPEARNATLYHLLFVRTSQRFYYVFEKPVFSWFGDKWPGYEGPVVNIPSPKYFKLIYVSKPNGWVLVYEIDYSAANG